MRALPLVCVCLSLGCALDRGGLRAQAFDPGEPDAARVDATAVLDATAAPGDATLESDAGVLEDAAPVSDAYVEVDACVSSTERCDGRDDDCDGALHEGATDCPCRAGHDDTTGHAYLYCGDWISWPSARERCRSYGYDLVVIDDAGENEIVRSGMSSFGVETWIGLSDTEVEGTYVWTDGRVQRVGMTDMGYASWQGGEPNDFVGEDCCTMRTDGRWNDADCDDVGRPFVCEAAPAE